MNRQAFFDAIRPAFGTLSGPQVDGMGALLDAGDGLPLHHMANVLAQVRRETGGYMSPIKETVMPHHKDKNPSDAEVIRRLDRAFAAGKLKWVKTPYWSGGWFGRGQIQVTHWRNYEKFGIMKPDDALKLDVSARVAVKGMSEGLFTGKKLADYDFPAALDAPPARNPRRIVNGPDGSDKEVAAFHRQFAAALEAAGWGAPAHERDGTLWLNTTTGEVRVGQKPAIAPERPVQPPSAAPAPATHKPATGLLALILRALAALFGRK